MTRTSGSRINTVRARLFTVLATIVILVGSLAVIGFIELRRVGSYSTDVADHTALQATIQELAIGLPKLEADLERYLLVGGGQDRAALEEGISDLRALTDDLESHAADDPELATHVAEISVESRHLTEALDGLLVGMSGGAISNVHLAQVVGLLSGTRELLNRYGSEVNAHVVEAVDRQHEIVSNVNAQLVFTVLLAFGVIVAAWMFIVRTVRSIGEVTDTAVAIMDGDLDRTVPVYRDDEIGLLATAFNSMTERLRVLIDDLEDRVRARTAQLTETNAALVEEVEERHRVEEDLKDYANRLEETIQELGETQMQLVQAQKLEAIGGLAAGVAHEINTPIQYVGDNARFIQEAVADLFTLMTETDRLLRAAVGASGDDEILEAYEAARAIADVEYLTDEIPSAVAQSIDGVTRVAEIVRALKDFAHPGSGEMVPLDLNRVVSDALAVSKNEWKYVAEMTAELDPDLPPVPGLSGPLGQAVLIILVNAAQAIADVVGDEGGKGRITVSTTVVDGHAVVAVGDTGGGIPDEVKDRVFDHFFTTKKMGKGSGQGLSIARKVIVDQHRGELSFETEPGVGTTFLLRLPLVCTVPSEDAA